MNTLRCTLRLRGNTFPKWAGNSNFENEIDGGEVEGEGAALRCILLTALRALFQAQLQAQLSTVPPAQLLSLLPFARARHQRLVGSAAGGGGGGGGAGAGAGAGAEVGAGAWATAASVVGMVVAVVAAVLVRLARLANSSSSIS